MRPEKVTLGALRYQQKQPTLPAYQPNGFCYDVQCEDVTSKTGPIGINFASMKSTCKMIYL